MATDSQGAASSEGEKTPWQVAEKDFNSKQQSQFYDPCQEAASRSIRCMQRNSGDKDMCTDYFQAYRDCKKQWIAERKAAKWKTG